MRALSWLLSLTLLAPAGRIINFDSYKAGQTPPGWMVPDAAKGGSEWEIRADLTAPTPPNVLVSGASVESRSQLAIFDAVNAKDADVSVRLKPVSGHEESGGVVWRYRDANNYFAARANARDNTVSIFKVENGRREPVYSGVKHSIPVNSWSILKVSVRGARIQVFLDHRRVLDAQDRSFSGVGKCGLWSPSDSTVYFDDFRVYPK